MKKFRKTQVLFILIALMFASGFYYTLFYNPEHASASWYNSSWLYRKQITIDNAMISGGGDLTSFPVLVSVTDNDFRYTASGGHVASSTAGDIVFTSSDGTTKLDHEIELYTSATGQLVAWVEIPTLTVAADTVIYIYYGNAGASYQPNPTGVWDTNYKGVWHMHSAATPATDSTTGGSHAAATGGVTFGATGKINSATDLNGTTNKLQVTTATLDLSSALSVSVWFKTDKSDAAGQRIFEHGGTGSSPFLEYDLNLDGVTAAKMGFEVQTGGTLKGLATSASFTPGTWYHLTGTWDGTTMRLYVNGVVEAGTTAASGTINETNNLNTIGFRDESGTGSQYFDGIIDEVRVSNIARSAAWIATEYNNQSSPSTYITFLIEQNEASASQTGTRIVPHGTLSSGTSWYATGGTWTYRRRIVVDRTKVTDGQANFPMLISTTNTEFKSTGNGGKVGQTDGGDILFTGSDGSTKLSHEIEKYTATTGEIVTWVKIPYISSTTTTEIYMYYGNASVADQADAANVWDSNYDSIWHLKESGNGTLGEFVDSTVHGNHGQGGGGTGTKSPSQATGQIGSGNSFDGTDDYINVADHATLDVGDVLTLETWVKRGRITVNPFGEVLMSKSDTSYVLAIGNNNKVILCFYNLGCPIESSTTITDTTTWHHIVATKNGTTRAIYIDGVSVGVNGTNATGLNNAYALHIGAESNTDGSATEPIQAVMDEVRLSNSARSAHWVITEYNNQSSPSTFYSIEGLQTESRTNGSGVPMPVVKVRGGVKFR